MVLLWTFWLKNTACLYMPFEKSYIRNNGQGLQECGPCFAKDTI